MKLNQKMSMKTLAVKKKKKCLIVAIIPLSQNTMIIQTNCNSNKLVIGKMRDETAGVAMK